MRSLRHTGKAKRTRIAMVVHAYYERDARVRRYAEALAETGWEVDVFCLRDHGEARRQRKNGVDIIRVPITRARGSKFRYFLEYFLSFLLFSTGATLPVLPFLFSGSYTAVAGSAALSAVGLFTVGAGITLLTGRSAWYSGLRQVVLGLAAAVITFGIGTLVGNVAGI